MPSSPEVSEAKQKTRATDRFRKLATRITGRKAKPESTSSDAKDPIESPDDGNHTPGQSGGRESDESEVLAAKIRNLIDSLPIPSPGSSRTSPRKAPAHDKSGKPIPPPEASRTDDEKLISYLNSATIMNGGKGGNRESVWSILDSLGAPKHDSTEGSGSQPNEGDGNDDGTSDHETLDDSSIMMYAPLVPTKDSVVELAETQLVPADASHTPLTPALATIQAFSSFSWWPPKFWPFTAWNSGDDKTTQPAPVRVWVPSTTKLSFQVMWWGYRIYLPPPVLSILSDKQLEATKRAAMITTALTWFFGHIPITALPPQIQPAILLLQKLVPFVGYIGTFISWSWSTIKSYDIGYGVYLTATWILPVALIPGTWQSYDFPTTPSTPSRTPATTIPSNPSPVPNNPAPATSPPKTGLWKYLRVGT